MKEKIEALIADFGWLYGLLLNKVKGEEMTIAMYIGFQSKHYQCVYWNHAAPC